MQTTQTHSLSLQATRKLAGTAAPILRGLQSAGRQVAAVVTFVSIRALFVLKWSLVIAANLFAADLTREVSRLWSVDPTV